MQRSVTLAAQTYLIASLTVICAVYGSLARRVQTTIGAEDVPRLRDDRTSPLVIGILNQEGSNVCH
jgi:hypothetical protein